MIFPLKLGPGQHPFLNSQIWGYGGGGWNGVGEAGGSECDPRNYDPMVQRDNYCEVRGWGMPLCPAGRGHQGQDIRPPSCKDNAWEVVATVDGVITLVTRNTTVVLKGDDGTQYRYLHMHPDSITVSVGQRVTQGDTLGRVSQFMNGARQTTRHLHFDILQRITIGDRPAQVVEVPTYTSLIAAYRKAKGLSPSIDANGNLVIDPRYEIGAVATGAGTPVPQAPVPLPTPPAAPGPVAQLPVPTPILVPVPVPIPVPAPTPAAAPPVVVTPPSAPPPPAAPPPTPATSPAPTPATVPPLPTPSIPPAPPPAPPSAPTTPTPAATPPASAPGMPVPSVPAPPPQPTRTWYEWARDGVASAWNWFKR
jgi:murein DD-endopeptidase MepM/ murein hydrolase activator NlpD